MHLVNLHYQQLADSIGYAFIRFVKRPAGEFVLQKRPAGHATAVAFLPGWHDASISYTYPPVYPGFSRYAPSVAATLG